MEKIPHLKKLLSIVMVLSLALLLALYLYMDNPGSKSPMAGNGQLDLSQWDFEGDGIASLSGVWSFYPNQLLEPEKVSLNKAYSIHVPGTWNEKQEGYKQPLRGEGTYRLVVTLPDTEAGRERPLQIRVHNILMAHRLYVNGELVKEMGRPTSSLNAFQARNVPYSIDVKPSKTLEIVIQVSNRVYFTGGVLSVQLGAADQVELGRMLAFGCDMGGFLVFILFGVYHLSLYQMRDKEPAYIYSGLFLLLMSVTIVTTSEKVLLQLVPNLPYSLAFKLQDFSLVSSLTMLILFIACLDPAGTRKKSLLLFLLPQFVYMGLILFTPYHIYTYVKGPLTLYTLLLLLRYVPRFLHSLLIRKKERLAGDGSGYAVVGMTLMGVMLLCSTLYYSGKTDSRLGINLSVVGFILAMNLFMARRFTNKMNEAQRLSEELIKANRVKDEFLARTSHDLKTPLHGIMNISAHLLNEEASALNGAQRENLSLIQDTAARLSYLVNDLNDLVRLRHEELTLSLTNVDLCVAVQVVFQLLSFDLKGKALRFVNHVMPGTYVQADENRLMQILYNLFANAVKHTHEGEITARVKEAGENRIFTLSDTGCGISKEEWERVFEEFYGEPEQKHFPARGSELGLYIGRELAKRMGGGLWVSEPHAGEGTTFCLSLPKGAPRRETAAFPQTAVEKQGDAFLPSAASAGASSSRILLVDDEPTSMRVLSLILKGQYRITGVHSGEEALRLLQNEKFHLVISDVMMPEMSGIELLRRIRQSFSMIELPVILATVRPGEKDIELALQTGANDYIAKPFSAEEIKSRVRSLLQLTQAMALALHNERAFLQAQIKPHFIYNAISNIIALCYEDGPKAAELLSLLSRYLRHIFQRDPAQTLIPLKQEIDIINIYVEIEKLRFGDRLSYETYFDPTLLVSEVKIPALIIQPLVENAIRHGLFNKNGEGRVYLSVTEGDGFIRVIVEDDGVGMSEDKLFQVLNDKKGGSLGVKNIQMRVASYPDAAFHIDSELEKGTRCALFLPKELI